MEQNILRLRAASNVQVPTTKIDAMQDGQSPEHCAQERPSRRMVDAAAADLDAATVQRAFAGRIIAVSGPIAAGKTTLGRAMQLLCEQHAVPCLFAPEVVNATALALYIEHQTVPHVAADTLFYNDERVDEAPATTEEQARANNPYAMPFQVHMLVDCQHRVREARAFLDVHRSYGTEKATAIVDRTAWDNTVFEEANRRLCGAISEHDARYYQAVAVGAPSFGVDQLVYLDVPPEVTLQRIGVRGAGAEAAYQVVYMRYLHDIWFHRIVRNYARAEPFAIHVFAWSDFGAVSLGDIVARLAQCTSSTVQPLIWFANNEMPVPAAFQSAARVHWQRDYATSTCPETRARFKSRVLALIAAQQRVVCV